MAFTCGACSTPFDDAAHKPLVLLCGHTYCQTCIVTTVLPKNKRKCLSCAKPLPPHVACPAYLPPNLAVIQAVQAPAREPRGTCLQCPAGHALSDAARTSRSARCDLCQMTVRDGRRPIHDYKCCLRCGFDVCSLCLDTCNDLRLQKCPTKSRALPVGQAAWAQAGDFVTVSPAYTSVGDAGSGPLKPGRTGLVLAALPSKSVKVRCCETDRVWKYSEEALRLVWNGNATEHLPRVGEYVALSDQACQEPPPDKLRQVSLGTLAPGDLGRVVLDDGSAKMPWKVEVLKSHCSTWYPTRALKRVPTASVPAQDPRLCRMKPGSVVEVTSVYQTVGDSGHDPLAPGDLGVVLKMDGDINGAPYLVVQVNQSGKAVGRPWWYRVRALRHAPEASVPEAVRQAARRLARRTANSDSDSDSDSSDEGVPLGVAVLHACHRELLVRAMFESILPGL